MPVDGRRLIRYPSKCICYLSVMTMCQMQCGRGMNSTECCLVLALLLLLVKVQPAYFQISQVMQLEDIPICKLLN